MPNTRSSCIHRSAVRSGLVSRRRPLAAAPMKRVRAVSKKPPRRFVLITGLSGSGKGSALKAFEDLGYHAVDNLPIDLIPSFAEMCSRRGKRFERAAVVVDIREGEAFSQLPTLYQTFARDNLKL